MISYAIMKWNIKLITMAVFNLLEDYNKLAPKLLIYIPIYYSEDYLQETDSSRSVAVSYTHLDVYKRQEHLLISKV